MATTSHVFLYGRLVSKIWPGWHLSLPALPFAGRLAVDGSSFSVVFGSSQHWHQLLLLELLVFVIITIIIVIIVIITIIIIIVIVIYLPPIITIRTTIISMIITSATEGAIGVDIAEKKNQLGWCFW